MYCFSLTFQICPVKHPALQPQLQLTAPPVLLPAALPKSPHSIHHLVPAW